MKARTLIAVIAVFCAILLYAALTIGRLATHPCCNRTAIVFIASVFLPKEKEK